LKELSGRVVPRARSSRIDQAAWGSSVAARGTKVAVKGRGEGNVGRRKRVRLLQGSDLDGPRASRDGLSSERKGRMIPRTFQFNAALDVAV